MAPHRAAMWPFWSSNHFCHLALLLYPVWRRVTILLVKPTHQWCPSRLAYHIFSPSFTHTFVQWLFNNAYPNTHMGTLSAEGLLSTDYTTHSSGLNTNEPPPQYGRSFSPHQCFMWILLNLHIYKSLLEHTDIVLLYINLYWCLLFNHLQGLPLLPVVCV